MQFSELLTHPMSLRNSYIVTNKKSKTWQMQLRQLMMLLVNINWHLYNTHGILKFIYSEKATRFCEIFPLLLTECVLQSKVRGKFWKIWWSSQNIWTVCTAVKRKGKISQNFVAFFRIYELYQQADYLSKTYVTL